MAKAIPTEKITGRNWLNGRMTEFVTPPGTLSYCFIARPRDDGKQTTDILFPKDDDLGVIEDAVMNALIDEHPGKKVLSKWKLNIIKDGDEKTNDDGDVMKGYEGMNYISVSNSRANAKIFDSVKHDDGRPRQVFDGEGDIPSEAGDVMYSGVIAQLKLWAIWYDHKESGSKGVRLHLVAACRTAKGERIGGGGGSGSEGFACDPVGAGVEYDDIPF